MPKECPKVPFWKDFGVGGESENEAPVWTPAPFLRFYGAKKAKDFDAISGRGPRSSGAPFSFAFDVFGWPPGLKKEAALELASAFFEVREFDDFRALRARSRMAAEAGAPES